MLSRTRLDSKTIGAWARDRTGDLSLFRAALYQSRRFGWLPDFRHPVGTSGLSPDVLAGTPTLRRGYLMTIYVPRVRLALTTLPSSGECSNYLSYLGPTTLRLLPELRRARGSIKGLPVLPVRSSSASEERRRELSLASGQLYHIGRIFSLICRKCRFEFRFKLLKYVAQTIQLSLGLRTHALHLIYRLLKTLHYRSEICRVQPYRCCDKSRPNKELK